MSFREIFVLHVGADTRRVWCSWRGINKVEWRSFKLWLNSFVVSHSSAYSNISRDITHVQTVQLTWFCRFISIHSQSWQPQNAPRNHQSKRSPRTFPYSNSTDSILQFGGERNLRNFYFPYSLARIFRAPCKRMKIECGGESWIFHRSIYRIFLSFGFGCRVSWNSFRLLRGCGDRKKVVVVWFLDEMIAGCGARRFLFN